MEYYLDKSHVSPGERAAFQGDPRRRVRRRRAAAHLRARHLHLLGLHPAGLPEASRHADRLHPRDAGRSRRGWPVRRSTARSARARAPPTTRPSWSSWRTDRRRRLLVWSAAEVTVGKIDGMTSRTFTVVTADGVLLRVQEYAAGPAPEGVGADHAGGGPDGGAGPRLDAHPRLVAPRRRAACRGRRAGRDLRPARARRVQPAARPPDRAGAR